MSQQAKSEMTVSEAAEVKSFARPDDVREFPKGQLELIKVGGATIGRAAFEPGWRWESSVQPIAHTKSCEAPHFQYHVAGVLRIKMDPTSARSPEAIRSGRLWVGGVASGARRGGPRRRRRRRPAGGVNSP